MTKRFIHENFYICFMMEAIKTIVCTEAKCPICEAEGTTMLKKLAVDRKMHLVCSNERYSHYMWKGMHYIVREPNALPDPIQNLFKFSELSLC